MPMLAADIIKKDKFLKNTYPFRFPSTIRLKGGEEHGGKQHPPYVEPIFRFCCKRLGNRYDAEDLSGEIICHILEGMEKYEVKSLDAWVWRIAHNRYARFIDARE